MVGTGVAAAVPVPGIAGAAAAQAQRSKYIFAVALAHNRTDVSAEMISEMFGVRPGTAQGFIRKMVRNGVVDAPNANGIARLAEPLQRIVPQVVEHNPAGGYVIKGRLDEMTAKARDLAQDFLETETDPAENDLDDAPEPDEISLSDDDSGPPEASGAARSAG